MSLIIADLRSSELTIVFLSISLFNFVNWLCICIEELRIYGKLLPDTYIVI